MHVLTDREVPEYEIHPTELDLSNSVKISKVIAFFPNLFSKSYRNGEFTLFFITVCVVDRVPFTRLRGVELMWLLKRLERKCSLMKIKCELT